MTMIKYVSFICYFKRLIQTSILVSKMNFNDPHMIYDLKWIYLLDSQILLHHFVETILDIENRRKYSLYSL